MYTFPVQKLMILGVTPFQVLRINDMGIEAINAHKEKE